ncbi:DUF389 domain-containing protein [Maridesulfovibrio sp.]|uniref:DUF389 domain-containing protein n=1 Tax=Maridesulfovibrio sp. TaxID=2795000 RepID=UPI002A18C1F0|nr:DUF389 domain-containing protein [Maridesulfovibrio sp.]
MAFIFRRKPRERARTPLLFVTDMRREFLITDISRNSAPHGMYYLLMSVAVFIAAFGLMADSPAVVIGAMLVSPLMTPIFGLSLGLVRGELPLIRSSMFSLVAGILLGIGGGYVIGILPVFFDVTHEIVARTTPNLLDMGVAAFAGIAGAVALIDEKVSPVMPGIAIATSLVPPLSASGLCLALGQYSDGWGAFLLFFANFLVILTVASALFCITGFIPVSEDQPLPRLIKHFSITTLGLILVAGFLTQALVEVSVSRRIDKSLRTAANVAIASMPNTVIKTVTHETNDGVVEGFIALRGPRSMKASDVEKMEKMSSGELKMPVRIIVRTGITQSISSMADSNIKAAIDAHAKRTKIKKDRSAVVLAQAEIILRTLISEYPWYTLVGVNYMELKSGPGLIVEISGPERPHPDTVRKLEDLIRRKTEVKDLGLIVRYYKCSDITRNGRNLFGTGYTGVYSKNANLIEADVTELLGNIRNVFPIYVEAQLEKSGWKVLADVTGEKLVTSKEVERIEDKLSEKFKSPVRLFVYSKTEALVERGGFMPVEQFSDQDGIKRLTVGQ